MTGSVMGRQNHFAEFECLPILDPFRLKTIFGATRMTDANRDAPEPLTQLSRTAEEIGVNMGLEDSLDGYAVTPRQVQIHLAVGSWIDNCSRARTAIAGQVRKLGDTFGVNLLEDQRHKKWKASY